MKVLHIFNSINHSGAEIMYEAAAPIFIENNLELLALSTGEKKGDFIDSFKKAGFSIFHLPYQKKYSLRYYAGFFRHFFNYYKLMKDEKVDVVHIHKRHLFWMYSLIAKIAGARTIIRTIHNVFTPPWYRYTGYYLARRFASILGVIMTSISPSVESHEKKWFRNNTLDIYNWYNDKEFYPAKNENEKISIREKLNIDVNDIVLITVGACLKKKNHKMVIDAVSKLKNKPESKLIYLHLGTGPLAEDEKNHANELELSDEIIFFGTTTHVREMLIASDIYLMPSDYEGMPISALEAMACRIPCIFFDVPGLKDLIPSGSNNGMLIRPDQESLKSAIEELKNSPGLRKKYSENGKSFVENNFSMRTQVKKFIELYRA